ncbi:MAG: hypothetical protein U0172_12555 [Nitrospiraceae bacterium]
MASVLSNTHSQSAQRGIALIAALILIVVVSLTGMAALHLATQEIQSVHALQRDAVSVQLAEGSAELVMSWMHAPSTIPTASLQSVLQKRHSFADGADGAGASASFFDATGRSQFHGTADSPDVLLDVRRSTDAPILDGVTQHVLHGQGGRLTELKLYAPASPEYLCTVEVQAEAGQAENLVSRKVRVQLAAIPLPNTSRAIRAGTVPAVGGAASAVFAHWGEIDVLGDATIAAWKRIPARVGTASVDGRSYYDMPGLEDRWTGWAVGSLIRVLEPTSYDQGLPLNVRMQQLPIPGMAPSTWTYEKMKQLAVEYGSYYRSDRMGRLHRQGASLDDEGLSLDDVMKSEAVGSTRGLIFVDTIDQQAPRHDNLAHLSSTASYAEGVFVLNAHVSWLPEETGVSLAALSPPLGEAHQVATRVPVGLSGINLNGALIVAGDLVVQGRARVYGAVQSDGALTASGAGLEVWFNDDMRDGYYRGLPVVKLARGTWRFS